MLITRIRLPELELLADTLDAYVLELAAVRALAGHGVDLQAPVTFLVGDNGSGKSTLIEAIALQAGFPAAGGPLEGWDGRGRGSRTGTESKLANQLILRTREPIMRGFFLRAETQFEMVSQADMLAAKASRNTLSPELSLHQRSHGESVFDLMGEAIAGKGLYLFDEPESGLSVVRQMALIAEIHLAVQAGAQFIIATHSHILPAVPHAQILEISEEGLIPRSFDEIEAVQATREFLADPAGVVRYLTAD